MAHTYGNMDTNRFRYMDVLCWCIFLLKDKEDIKLLGNY